MKIGKYMVCIEVMDLFYYLASNNPHEVQLRSPPWLPTELETNRKLFPDHLSFMFHGAWWVLVHSDKKTCNTVRGSSPCNSFLG
jgi:hypothetical protein